MVFEKVRNMIATQLQVDPASITMESRLVEDLKADSANVMVMILEMETEFGMEVEDEVILHAQDRGRRCGLYRKASVILRRTGCASAHPSCTVVLKRSHAVKKGRSFMLEALQEKLDYAFPGLQTACAGR